MTRTITPNTLVKVLGPDRMPCHGGSGQWPEPGIWRHVDGDLIPCENGLHVCSVAQLPQWLGPEIWLVAVRGAGIDHEDKILVPSARLIKRLETWNDRTARLFACDCAEHVLPIYEKHEGAKSAAILRDTIAIARRYANGHATDGELAAAGAAARDAEHAWQIERLCAYLNGEMQP